MGSRVGRFISSEMANTLQAPPPPPILNDYHTGQKEQNDIVYFRKLIVASLMIESKLCLLYILKIELFLI